MNKKPYPKILDAVVDDQIRADLNLTPQIMSRIQKRNKNTMKPQTKLFTAVALFLMVFAVLFFAVPGVAAAIQRWFGYIPGIGLVHEGQIRVLAAPVSVTRDGITITVEKALISAEKTVIIYKVDGVQPEMFVTNPIEKRSCGSESIIRASGIQLSPLNSPHSINSWSTGYETSIIYPAISTTVQDATFVIPCILMTEPGKTPENWELLLHFEPAPPEMTSFPVIEIPTAAESPTATMPVATEAAPQTPVSDTSGFSLTLDRAVQMDDGYLIYATMHWPRPDILSLDIPSPYNAIHLRDASGREMLYESVDDENTGVNYDQHKTVFALKTAPITDSSPLSIIVNSVSVEVPTDATFTFNPGPNPQPSQTWQLNQPVQIGEFSLRVVSVVADKNGSSGYSFNMQSDSGIISAMLGDKNHPQMGGGGSADNGMDDPSSSFSTGFSYEKGLPAGPVTVLISSISIRRAGPWQAEWTPPAASIKVLPTHPAACLTASGWRDAIRQKPALPQGMGGKLLLSNPDPASGEIVYSVSNLDGSNAQTLTHARDAALSPDGAKLAYSLTTDGIHILDVATGQSTHLTGTAKFDFNPLWSPDGSQIVFMRGDGHYDLYIINTDGSGLRALISGGTQEWPIGWMPDGKHLLYSLPGTTNSLSYLLDSQNGESQPFPVKDIAALSPDGKYVLTNERTFGERWTYSLSNLDGSNRSLLVDSDLWILNFTFSPDGQWLMLGVSETNSFTSTPTLVHLQDCQIIPLPNLKGGGAAWVQPAP